MDKFDVNKYMVTDYYVYLEEAYEYLTGLYYKTGEKYCCQALKIQLLLTIYQLWCLKYNKTGIMPNHLVKLEITSNKSRFRLKNILLPTDIIKGTTKEDKTPIIDEFLDSYKIPPLYKVENDFINKEVGDLLELIFRKFGNWSAKDLVNESKFIINSILSIYGNLEFVTADVINNKDIKHLWSESSNNEIVDFICKTKPKTTSNRQILNKEKFVADFGFWFNALSFEDQEKFIQICNDFSKTLIEEPRTNNKVKSIEKRRIF